MSESRLVNVGGLPLLRREGRPALILRLLAAAGAVSFYC